MIGFLRKWYRPWAVSWYDRCMFNKEVVEDVSADGVLDNVPEKKKFSIKWAVSVATLIILAFVVYQARDQFVEAWGYMQNMNIWVLLLIVPGQIFMYYAAGQVYFAFLRAKKKGLKASRLMLTRLSLELNFMNHAIPSGGAAGLGYLVWRMREFKVTAGQATFMQILRFGTAAITTTNQMWVALIILVVTGSITEAWAGWTAAAVCVGMVALYVVILWLIMSKKRVEWFSKIATDSINWLMKKVRLNKNKYLNGGVVKKFFVDLHEDWLMVKKNPKLVLRSFGWAMLYSFLEVAAFWIVAISLGSPGILPQLMLGQGVAGIVGTVIPTPGGIGGYEGSMIAILIATGVDSSVAIITVIVTRVVLLAGTVVFGWGFYQHALLSKKKK